MEYTHILVKGDFGSGDDIGIVSIRNQNNRVNGLTDHHWIKFPNGELRSEYASERIDAQKFDLMKAFGMVPQLKVCYRPISDWLSTAYEHVAMFAMVFFIIMGIFGTLILVSGYFFQQADAIINNLYGGWIAIVLLAALGFSIVGCLACQIASSRYFYLSKGDKALQKWNSKH